MKLDFKRFFVLANLLLFANFILAQTPEGFTWQEVHNVNFGDGANHFAMEAASSGSGGEVELRLDTAEGPVIGRVFFHHTGDSSYFLPYECELYQAVSGVHDVYMNFLDYTKPVSGGVLKIGDFQFNLVKDVPVVSGDSLHIYPPVPGLDPSPYYEIFVQKVSELNLSNLAEVTNWETPFAWFTQCPDDKLDGDNDNYYSRFIGGWSHTYCNFELDSNTPIVVKIMRKDETGDDAPSGPISKASVYPAHNVDSWEIIDGDVYITMSKPALLAVDIDGQMDDRVSPRAKPNGWGDDVFPFNNKKDGAHSVSIFANPFIDKPNPDDPGVLVVKAGEKIPENLHELDWDLLYFEPGVHKTSVDENESGELVERRWKDSDIIQLNDDKSYYIPGDAMVYGNFSDVKRSNNKSENIRLFGHGTISGSKILHYKHWDDYPDSTYPHEKWTRPLNLTKAKNAHYEGITLADPAHHAFCMISYVNEEYPVNTIKWAKMIGWRGNSDGTAIGGHIVMEDCFLRPQDDAHYIGGAHTMRRVVMWHDANGKSFRGDFVTRRYSKKNAPNIPKLIVIEDIDLIYERGVFATTDNNEMFGMIGVNGAHSSNTLTGGVKNTGQMIVFRDIRITDPNPTRGLFVFDLAEGMDDFAGIRFENIEYSGVQSFGWKKNGFKGGPNAAIRNFVFDNVIFNGEKMDQKYVAENFVTDSSVFDMTYRRHDTISSTGFILTSTATNGWITITAGKNPGEVNVTASPAAGYKFSGWSGNLSGNENEASIAMDSDKSITANFSLIKYAVSTAAENGTIVLEPADGPYLPGTKVTVKVVGDLGYGFELWGGDLSGTENPTTIVVDSDKTVSANFKEVETYTLNIDPSYGSVILDPPGGEYNPGTVVTLIPEADPGYYFEQWFGDIEGSDTPARITMDTDNTVEARFVFGGTGGSHVAINFGGPDYTDSDGTLYKSNTEGSIYSNNNSISGTEDDALYQSQRYGKDFSLSYPVENGIYEIILMFSEVYFNDSGKRKFSVALEGEEVITDLDIYAKVGANTSYNESFRLNITDGEININLSASINNAKINALRIMGEEFQGQNYHLTTNAPSNGVVEITPLKESYPEGSNIVLNAIPSEGYRFEGWSGDLSGTETPFTLYMNANKNITAVFSEITNNSDLFAEQKSQIEIYPNPFSTETTISYQLGKAEHIKISIHNLLGQKISILVEGRQAAGVHQVNWDGKQTDGKPVPPGMYICRFETSSGVVQTTKMILAR